MEIQSENTMMSPSVANLAEALAAAQASLSTVAKDRDVTVQHKSGNSHSYSYATLAGVWDALRAAFPANGLSITQGFKSGQAGAATLRTMLLHKSGEWIASEITFGLADDPQVVGSRITYYRRYALSALVGVTAADEDDDGASGNDSAQGEAPPARTYHTSARSMGDGPGYHSIKFGKDKNKPLTDPSVDVAGLKWYLSKIREGADDPQNRYQEQNRKLVPVIEAEIARRQCEPSEPEQGGAADDAEMVLLETWRGRYREAAKRGKAALDAELKAMLESVTDALLAKQLQTDYNALAEKFAARAAAR